MTGNIYEKASIQTPKVLCDKCAMDYGATLPGHRKDLADLAEKTTSGALLLDCEECDSQLVFVTAWSDYHLSAEPSLKLPDVPYRVSFISEPGGPMYKSSQTPVTFYFQNEVAEGIG